MPISSTTGAQQKAALAATLARARQEAAHMASLAQSSASSELSSVYSATATNLTLAIDSITTFQSQLDDFEIDIRALALMLAAVLGINDSFDAFREEAARSG